MPRFVGFTDRSDDDTEALMREWASMTDGPVTQVCAAPEQQEPSMEDILASIRRIMSEDDETPEQRAEREQETSRRRAAQAIRTRAFRVARHNRIATKARRLRRIET